MTGNDKFVIRWIKESGDVDAVNTKPTLEHLWNLVIQEMAVLYPQDVVVKQYCEYLYKRYVDVFEGAKPTCEDLVVRLEQLEDLIWALELGNHGGS
jgi:hypothetical protein